MMFITIEYSQFMQLFFHTFVLTTQFVCDALKDRKKKKKHYFNLSLQLTSYFLLTSCNVSCDGYDESPSHHSFI